MRKKIIFLCIAISAIMAITFVSVYADDIRAHFDKAREQQKADEASKQTNRELADEEKELDKKIKQKLQDAWDDIKKTHKIDESLYTKVEFEELDTFFDGEFDQFKDKDFLNGVKLTLLNNLHKPPKGSTYPNILFKNDSSEVLVAFKLADGRNCVKRMTKSGNEWTTQENITEGKAAMKID